MRVNPKREAAQLQKAKDGGLIKPDGTWAGGSRSKAARIKELEAENAALRKRLDMTEPMTLTVWESSGTPHLRSEMAARALYQEWLNPRRAMKLLGFDNKDATDEKLQERVLRTPEVTEMLLSVLEQSKELKKKIMERCVQNAILGSEETSIRATEQLSKWVDWIG